MSGKKIPVSVSDEIIKYVESSNKDESEVLADLLKEGYEARLKKLYQKYRSGELTIRKISKLLGLSYREFYRLLEEKELPF